MAAPEKQPEPQSSLCVCGCVRKRVECVDKGGKQVLSSHLLLFKHKPAVSGDLSTEAPRPFKGQLFSPLTKITLKNIFLKTRLCQKSVVYGSVQSLHTCLGFSRENIYLFCREDVFYRRQLLEL